MHFLSFSGWLDRRKNHCIWGTDLKLLTFEVKEGDDRGKRGLFLQA